ncbi:tetratricopeptide repeat protein [Ekhidna sp. MALMAid0563]|uniref:O-linked N-acetylglucosamine transferase family protein n=1 Tax=Ekhidna sp. MALMAid0563 TaxID=3143937 RepID=UPI0032DEA417
MARLNVSTYYKTAVDLHTSGKFKEARKLYQEILKIVPRHWESLYMIGQSYYQEHRFDSAIVFFDKGLKINPKSIELRLQKSRAQIKVGRLEEALKELNSLVSENKENPKVVFHAARALKETGKYEESISMYNRLLELDPYHKQGLNNLANLYQQVFNFKKALETYERIIELDPSFAMAYCNKAGLLQKLGHEEEAEDLYNKTLAIDNKNHLAYYNLGVIESSRHNDNKALELLETAIRLDNHNLKYISTYAYNLYKNGDKEKGIGILNQSIKNGAKSEEPYVKLGKIYMQEQRFEKALKVLLLITKKNKYAWEAIFLCGIVADFTQQLELAERYLLQINKHPEFALRANMTLQLLYSKIGKVEKYEEMLSTVTKQLEWFVNGERKEEEIPVYNLMYFPFEQELISSVLKKYTGNLIERVSNLRDETAFTYKKKTNEKIKVGYLCPSFVMHPSAHLIIDTFKYHDRAKFEVYAYNLAKHEDEMTGQLKQAVDHFINLEDLKIENAAKKINADEIDILISLSGYNFGMKMEIPALKPAPIQILTMDWHGSLQGDFFDYVLKDEMVLTEKHRTDFNESVAYLPYSHFIRSEMTPSKKEVTRKDYGLPEGAFVFGCLNHTRKLSKMVVDAWIEILSQVPNSYLWLYSAGQQIVERNLTSYFEERGITTNRVVFCKKEHYKDHYKRMGLMDLFLDTPVYNGHTTVLEALWMGVPVLTLQGESVNARLGASFVKTAGLPELVTENINDYINRAVDIASGNKVSKLRDQLKSSKPTSALFDIGGATKNLEKAYMKMWEIYTKGEKPHDFKV